MDRDIILGAAVVTYGREAQTMLAIEEMAELTKALCKLGRAEAGEDYGRAVKNVIEEMADVRIMIDQLVMIYGSSQAVEDEKLERLEKRIRSAMPDRMGEAGEMIEGGERPVRLKALLQKFSRRE